MLGTASTDAVNRAPATSYSEVTGITQTARNFGATLGLAIMGAVLISRNETNVDRRADQGRGARQRRPPGGELVRHLGGSGGGSGQPHAIVHDVQLAFAHSTQTVFYIMAGIMAATFIVTVRWLPRGRVAVADEEDDRRSRWTPGSTRRAEQPRRASRLRSGQAEAPRLGHGLAAASERPSLPRIADTWWSTVLGETTSRSAISALRSPSARSGSTSSWRAVRPAGFSRVCGRGPRGTPRSPSSRSRRAAIAAAGRAPSCWRRVERQAQRARVIRIDEGKRRVVRAAAGRATCPRRACQSPLQLHRGRALPRSPEGQTRTPARRRQRASSPVNSEPRKVDGEVERPLRLCGDRVRSPFQPQRLGARRRCRGEELEVADVIGDAPAPRRAAASTWGSPRRARTSARTSSASWRGPTTESGVAHRGSRRPVRRHHPSRPAPAGRPGLAGDEAFQPRLEPVLTAVRDPRVEVAIGLRPLPVACPAPRRG